MRIKLVSVDSIAVDEANVRKHPKRNLQTIEASLKRFGQQVPLVVDREGVIRKGNGTYQAAINLGWERIAVIYSDLGKIDAGAFSIADNRSSELADWDEVGLAEQLRALQSEEDGELMEAVGFDGEEISALLKELGDDQANGEQTEQDQKEEEEPSAATVRCPKCGHTFKA